MERQRTETYASIQIVPLRIPTSFWLHGKCIEVVYDEACPRHEEDSVQLAEARYFNQQITLSPSKDYLKTGQSFCHELVHWILYQMSHELRENESFVELFSALLHQAFVTMDHSRTPQHVGSNPWGQE